MTLYTIKQEALKKKKQKLKTLNRTDYAERKQHVLLHRRISQMKCAAARAGHRTKHHGRGGGRA